MEADWSLTGPFLSPAEPLCERFLKYKCWILHSILWWKKTKYFCCIMIWYLFHLRLLEVVQYGENSEVRYLVILESWTLQIIFLIYKIQVTAPLLMPKNFGTPSTEWRFERPNWYFCLILAYVFTKNFLLGSCSWWKWFGLCL